MNESASLPLAPRAGPRPLRLGDAAPNFRARATTGEVNLQNFRGRWLIFFSHPADFTPVCTSEFLGLAKAADEFSARGCALLGLSIDSLYAHLAWVRAIRELFGVLIPFPIIEDPSMAIGRAYGMIDEDATDSASVRATYFIDPAGMIRAISWYPMQVGRSVDEMLRLLTALQRTEAQDVLTPADWQPGQDLLLPPMQAQGEPLAAPDWFYRLRPDK